MAEFWPLLGIRLLQLCFLGSCRMENLRHDWATELIRQGIAASVVLKRTHGFLVVAEFAVGNRPAHRRWSSGA